MKKVALITGAAKGIGKQLAVDLAKNGYDLIVSYLTSFDKIKELEEELKNKNVNIDVYEMDLSNKLSIKTVSESIKRKYNKIDVLINNAALSLDSPFNEKTKEEFMKVLEVNLVGPFLLIQNLSDELKNSKIFNIASTDGINTYSKLNMDYSASKAGLINLTKSLALEFESAKIYAICPNWVNTESIREMDDEYLKDEMKRVNQKKLIEPREISERIIKVINDNIESGSIIIMEESDEYIRRDK